MVLTGLAGLTWERFLDCSVGHGAEGGEGEQKKASPLPLRTPSMPRSWGPLSTSAGREGSRGRALPKPVLGRLPSAQEPGCPCERPGPRRHLLLGFVGLWPAVPGGAGRAPAGEEWGRGPAEAGTGPQSAGRPPASWEALEPVPGLRLPRKHPPPPAQPKPPPHADPKGPAMVSPAEATWHPPLMGTCTDELRNAGLRGLPARRHLPGSRARSSPAPPSQGGLAGTAASSPRGAPRGDAGTESVAEPEQDQGCRVPAATGLSFVALHAQPGSRASWRTRPPREPLWWLRAGRARHAWCASLTVFGARGVCGFGAPTCVFAAVGGCCAAVGAPPSLPGSGAGWREPGPSAEQWHPHRGVNSPSSRDEGPCVRSSWGAAHPQGALAHFAEGGTWTGPPGREAGEERPPRATGNLRSRSRAR